MTARTRGSACSRGVAGALEAVARGNPLYHVMKRRMYAGECPNEAADGRAGAGGGGARDGYAAALADALGEDSAATAGDHQAALGALETREAERREAERLEKERLEAERVAAARREAERRERLRAERRRQREEDEREEFERMRREAEYARSRQELIVNTMRQISEAWGAALQGSGASQSGYDDCSRSRIQRAQRGISGGCR